MRSVWRLKVGRERSRRVGKDPISDMPLQESARKNRERPCMFMRCKDNVKVSLTVLREGNQGIRKAARLALGEFKESFRHRVRMTVRSKDDSKVSNPNRIPSRSTGTLRNPAHSSEGMR